VPTLRVGDQPYGILPVMARTDASHSSETKQRIAAAVEVLIEEWRQALPAVPVLDHNATDASRPGGELSNAEARDLVTAVLANNPHARRIAIRAASDWSDQPQPGIFGATARAVAVRSTVEQPVGNDLWWEPVLMELTGGFRWEYHDALEMLDTRYGTTLKPLYEGVRHEIAPAGPVLDDGVVTDPIGGVGRAAAGDPAARTLEPSEMPSSEDDIRGIEQQIEIWVQTDSRIPTWGITLEWAKVDLPEVHELAQDVIEQLERHELRQRPLRWLGVPGLDGVLGRDDLQLLLTRFASVERLWRRATVQDDDPPAGITAATYLEHLSERARPGASDGGPFDPRPWDPTDPLPDGGTLPHRPFPFDLLPPEFTAAAPLLYQLIEATLNQSDDRAELSEALARLAVLDPGDLDWLLRETLGLGSHRLDAWHTSLATERLSAMRDASPNGLYVGSIGFVLDLDRATDRPSHGFIHAPSLPHAASAAVLRSGWLARGDNDSESPSAIDLASGRVRDADFMLSGVRHGQDLGDLLGAQFERSLHDARLDVAIRPLRLALAAVDGLGESAADQPIDGIRLLDLHRDGQFRSTIDALELGQEPRRQLVAELDRLESTFDAIDDVTTFETVHQLVVGNLERAAAVVDGMGPNGGRPPELLGVRTPRGALTIDTRALVLIEATATSADAGWATGTRDLFDPALDAWVATVLPPPADVGWLATSAEGKAVEVRLSELGLSALDACFLASDDPRAVTPGLRRLAELADPRRTLTDVQPTEGGSARITLAEFQLLAIELKRLIQESTPADGRSVVAPEDVLGSNSDAGDTIERGATALDALMGDFDAVVKGGSWSDLTHEQSTTLARLGLVPSPTTDPSDDFASLQARLARRRSRADAVEGTDSIEGMRLRVAEITGMAVPLLVDFHMPDDGGVELSGALATADEIDDWFDVVASVHPTVGALWRAMGISTLLGQSPPTVAAGQAPLLDDDPWVALHRPRPGSGGRVAVAAITHGAVDPGTSVVGLVVDQWAERIPADDQVTGVAFHFDAPSAEAPQTMLLAVPPEGRGWSVDLVLDTMLQTIEWMQLRTVAVDDLGDYGHALPTTFVPGALDGSAVEDVTQ
jgi:hypothetical protein